MQIHVPLNPAAFGNPIDIPVFGTCGPDLRFTLESYAEVLPLVPGDILAITGQDATGTFVSTELVTQRECWLFELHVRVPAVVAGRATDGALEYDMHGLDDDNWDAASLACDLLEAELATLVETARPSRFTLQVATDDAAWVYTLIQGTPSIGTYSIMRRPGEVIDMVAALMAPEYPEFKRDHTLVHGG